MIYVDSNVPMYLVGAQHPNKRRAIEVTSQLITGREELVTSAETYQEIIHRFLALRDREHLVAAYDVLEKLTDNAANVTKADVDQARAVSAEHGRLSARDCLHVAIMQRLGCTRLWSFDEGFDQVPAIQRIA